MLAVLIGGLLLSAIQSSQSQLTQTPENPQTTTNFQRLIQRPLDEMVPFDGMSPRFWFSQGYRQAFQHMIQMYEEPNTNKGLNIYQGTDGMNSHGANTGDDTMVGHMSRERIALSASSLDEQPSVDKRDGHISMCYFKLCNLGRKRRIPQGLTGMIPTILNTANK